MKPARPSKLSIRLSRRFELAAGEPSEKGGLLPPPPSAEQLAKINAMPQVLRTLRPEDVYVFGSWAINDQLWHNGYRIETAGIPKIAELAIGAPLMANHDTYRGYEALPAGRIFDASTAKRADGSTWGALWEWMPATEFTTELAQRMVGGAISEQSVQILFTMLECSICKTDLYDCAHMPMQSYDGKMCEAIVRGVTDFLELSMVWAGMAKGTEWLLAASRGKEAMPAEKMLAARDPLMELFAKQPVIAIADLGNLFASRRLRAFASGDRVRIKQPHMMGHETGTVQIIEPGHPYGIVIDGMEGDGVHKWYAESELEMVEDE